MRLIHKARILGCLHRDPRPHRHPQLTTLNSTLPWSIQTGRLFHLITITRTMPIIVCISELYSQYISPSECIDYNQNHPLDNWYRRWCRVISIALKLMSHSYSFRNAFNWISRVIHEELNCHNISENRVRTIHNAKVYTSFSRSEQGMRLIYGCILYTRNYGK